MILIFHTAEIGILLVTEPVKLSVTAVSFSALTASVADPVMLDFTAVIVVFPAATVEAKPFEPDALLIVAAPVLLDAHVT